MSPSSSNADERTCDREGRRSLRDPLMWAVIGIVTLPLIVIAAAMNAETWYPTSDWALIEARTRDVGTVNTPLIGPYSRYGWNHPGPAMYFVLSPLYRLTGQAPSALLAGSALFNAGVLAAAVAVARRVGGRSMLMIIGVCSAVFVRAASETLIDPWNPFIAVAPFGLFVLTAWGLSARTWLLAPLMVAAGTFAIQSHVGYAVLVAPLIVWAVVAATVGARRSTSTSERHVRLAVASSAGVGLLMWAAPLVQQISRTPGNIQAIARYFLSQNSEPHAGLGASGDVIGRALAPFGPWIGFAEPLDPISLQVAGTSVLWALPIASLLVVTTVIAHRRRDRLGVLGGVTVGLAVLLGTVAVARINGVAYYHIVRWWWILGMLTWAMTLWLSWRMVGERVTRRIRSALMVTGLVVMLAFGFATSFNALGLALPGPERESTALTQIADDLRASIPAPTEHEAYWVEPAGHSWFEMFYGVVNHLDANGIGVVTEPGFSIHFGEHRTVGGRRARAPTAGTIVVVSGEDPQGFADEPAWRRIAAYDPLDSEQRAIVNDLGGRVRDQLIAVGRDEEAAWAFDRRVLFLLGHETFGLSSDETQKLSELVSAGEQQWVYLQISRLDSGP